MKQCAPIFLQQRAESKKNLAERVGFEPTIPVKVYTLSKRAPSATRPSLRARKQLIHYSEWQAQAVAEDSVLFAPSFETWRCHVSTLRFLVVPGACGCRSPNPITAITRDGRGPRCGAVFARTAVG